MRAFLGIALLSTLASFPACGSREPLPPRADPGSAVAAALHDSGFGLEWGTPAVPSRVRTGERFPAAVLVTNAGDETWMPARFADGGLSVVGAVRLGYRWRKAADPARTDIDFAPARAGSPCSGRWGPASTCPSSAAP